MSEKHIYKAIASVTAKLAREGISKGRKNEQQGYKFRGIDDVYNALAPFLAEEKLCILPNVQERSVVERVNAKGTALFYVTVKVDFAFVSAEDGSEHHVTTYGEAMDSGDKATNKAMSAAYKYAAMQAFCIPTEGDNDADAQTHTVIAVPESSKSVGKADFDKLPKDRQESLAEVAKEIEGAFYQHGSQRAYELYTQAKEGLPVEEQTALRSLLKSEIKTAFTKIFNGLQKEAA